MCGARQPRRHYRNAAPQEWQFSAGNGGLQSRDLRYVRQNLGGPRHTNVCKISDRTIPHREFAGLAVSFKNLDELPPGSPYLSPFSFEAFKADPELALLILAYFFRNRFQPLPQ